MRSTASLPSHLAAFGHAIQWTLVGLMRLNFALAVRAVAGLRPAKKFRRRSIARIQSSWNVFAREAGIVPLQR